METGGGTGNERKRREWGNRGGGVCGRERGEGEQILELGRRANRDAESVILLLEDE